MFPLAAIAPRIIIPGFFVGKKIQAGGSIENIAVSSAFTIFFITSVTSAFSKRPALAIIPTIAGIAYTFISQNPADADLYRISDWMLTTPIMLAVILYANGAPLNLILTIISLDILMIVSGYLGTKGKTPLEKNGYFGLGMAAFLPIAIVLLQQTKNLVTIYLTLAVWSLYPIIYYLQQNKIVEAKYTTTAYAIMDVVAKVGLITFLQF
jgi:bacteriorhodopsin